MDEDMQRTTKMSDDTQCTNEMDDDVQCATNAYDTRSIELKWMMRNVQFNWGEHWRVMCN